MSNSAIQNKILALLAKAEATHFEGEAAAYMAKAQELMIKHAVSERDLTPEQREQIAQRTVKLTASRLDRILLNQLCNLHSVKMIRDSQDRLGHLFGYETDVAFVMSLYASLLLQRESAVKRAYRPPYENAKSFNQAFRLAFGSRVIDRLRASQADSVSKAGTGTEIVLASRAQKAEAAALATFTNTSNTRTQVKATSVSGLHQGRQAGDSADVSGGRNHVSKSSAAALA